ncbi:MAG TPA: 2-oxo acid dehydrogenase subunit E2 [Bacteriovoracaceae bacterium]|nr:2-oxo acid dehydrogenase subunit E2 [Bacteriovoracaceae bacterium]
MIRKNVELYPPRPLSAWRKISIGSWRPVGDSQVYAELKIDATATLGYLEALNRSSPHRISMTHFLGKVMGKVLSEVGDLNSIIRWGRIQQRKHVDVFFHVAYGDTELSGVIVRDIDKKSFQEIAQELTKSAAVIKSGEDQSFKHIKKTWEWIPAGIARGVLDLIGFVSYSLNINIKGSGVPRDCFGSMMITNIGSLGFSQAFVPLSPYSRVPLVLALGKIQKVPVVLPDGTLAAQDQVGLCFTFDHRIMDGARGAKMSKLIEHYFLHPELL